MIEEIINSDNKFDIVRKYYILYPEKRYDLYKLLVDNGIIKRIVFDDYMILESIQSKLLKSPIEYIKSDKNDIVWLFSKYIFDNYLKNNYKNEILNIFHEYHF